MNDLIVGCATNYDWSKLKYWVNSINRSGFEGDKVLILMNCDKDTVKKISNSGFSIIAFNQDSDGNLSYNSNMMVHVERFFHIYQLLKDNLYRYVITTDVKDVIFQKNPSEWLEEWLGNDSASDDLVFSSESMKYKDEPWGNQNLLETFGPQIYEDFKNHTIFNVGVLAGRGYAMKDLMMNIFASCMHRPIKICDQSTFNFLISQHPYLKTSKYTKSEDGWACQLGTTADPSKIEQFRPFLLEPSPKMVDDKVVTSTGIEYTIVHQYDRVPEWKKVIEAKYDDK
jgi:hypothetical protein